MEKETKRTIYHRLADWLLNLILLACGGFVAWLLLIITTFSSFKVPTGRMESSILPGDYIWVNKWLTGARIFDVFMPTEGWRGKGVFPQDSLTRWSLLEFGPLYVPSEGDEMTMDRKHYSLYKHLIAWEQKKELSLKGDCVWLDDSLIQSYRFKENYYFMAGDRVSSSRDFRYWGLLPEPYIVGVATRIWKSVDKETGKIRWDRVMKAIE